MEYYVFQSQADAQACIDYINWTPWFPITGNINGIPAPDAQKTERWVATPLEMLSGEFAIPRIPTARLDAVGVSQRDRDQFLAEFGQDIRNLDGSAFPAPEPEEYS